MPVNEKADFKALIKSKFGDKVKVSFRSTKRGARGVIISTPGNVYAVLTVQNCEIREGVRVFNALNEIPQVN